MIEELIGEKNINLVILFILGIAVFVLLFASFRAGEIYVCREQGMELVVYPKLKCQTLASLELQAQGGNSIFYENLSTVCP